MTTVTLRPNALNSNGAGLTIGGGAASHQAAESDNSDATYTAFSATPSYIDLDVGTFSLPALAQVRSVTPRIRVSSASPSANGISFRVGTLASATTYAYPAVTSTITTFTGVSEPVNPSTGLAWTQADIDALAVDIIKGSGTASYNVFESYIDVVYNSAPTAVVTGPAEGTTLTSTSRPTVTWTYSDPDGDAQERYQIRITNTADTVTYWDSGTVLSNATTRQIGLNLTNGTYVARVRVADAGSNGRYGNWDTNTFTLAVTAPPVPTLTLTPDPTLARVRVDVNRTSTVPATDWYVVEYSDDVGVTWQSLLTAGQGEALLITGTVTTTYDYEIPFLSAREYRASSVRLVSGQELSSVPSSVVTATLAPLANLSWIKSRTLPSANISVRHMETVFSSTSTERQGIFYAEGRPDPVVMAGTVQTEVFEAIKLYFRTDAEYEAFELLRKRAEPLLFQTCYGDSGREQYWLRLGPDRQTVRVTYDKMATEQWRRVTMAAHEVRAPLI